jgi:hypothetical protein
LIRVMWEYWMLCMALWMLLWVMWVRGRCHFVRPH